MRIVANGDKVFPALAGMNRCTGNGSIITLSVPRARGDEPVLVYAAESGRVCSPRSRG